MNHLNFFAMFEIFYMPQMNSTPAANSAGGQNKKRFEVENEKIVEEEDEEYEDSKSHLEKSRKRTLEHKEKEEEE